jgi:hypothetical protein
MYNGVVYGTNYMAQKPKEKALQEPCKETQRIVARPDDDHPWRIPKQKRPRLSSDESDRELLEALFNSSRAWA